MAFDRKRLRLLPLSARIHDLGLDSMLPLERSASVDPQVRSLAGRIAEARRLGAPVLALMGAHVIRSGAQRHLIDLIKKGYITHLAFNGACMIHDFELALVGATTESVQRYIQEGQFGLWEETSRINDVVNAACRDGLPGMGVALGKAIREGDFPYREFSVFAACHECGIPATVHIGIGYDIIHEHPNFDGAAAGGLSYKDFLTLADTVSRLENGVVMNFGTAVMGPEVFLKALSMARNVARQDGGSITNFTTAVFDIFPLPESRGQEAAKDDPSYYFRPWKTLLIRTVSGGDRSIYIRGVHRKTIPALWTALSDEELRG